MEILADLDPSPPLKNSCPDPPPPEEFVDPPGYMYGAVSHPGAVCYPGSVCYPGI